MNYIKRMEADRKDLGKVIDAKNDALRHLAAYLRSDKFHQDTTVQAEDVLRRLRDVADAGMEHLDAVWQRATEAGQ